MTRLATLALTGTLLPLAAAADRVTVKGTTLEGTVKSISAKSVVMETVYGKGALTIPTADVTAIETEAPFHVYKADDGTEVGRVVGITPAAVSIARGDGDRRDVPFDEVQAAPRDPGPDASWLRRQRVESPWWHGHLDGSLSTTDGTTDTTSFALRTGATRERGPSRLKLEASYLRSTTKDNFADPPEDEEVVNDNELRGLVRQEYDLTSRFFVLGSLEAEHDGVEALSYRLIPRVGAGYKILNSETAYLAVDSGPSYVYEKYYDGSLNNYVALAFGAESRVKLPWLGASWYANAQYLPSLTDWLNDYRLRGETGLLVPIVEQLSFKASVIDDYNAQPAEDTSANTLTTLLGLSFLY